MTVAVAAAVQQQPAMKAEEIYFLDCFADAAVDVVAVHWYL